VQGAGAVSVGVAQLDRAQLFSFQFDQAVSQWFRSHVLAGDLTGKAQTPGPIEPRAVLGIHPCRDARCGHHSGVREAFEYCGSAEEVIAVRVVMKIAVTFLPAATTQSARARDSSFVMSASTRTASRSP